MAMLLDLAFEGLLKAVLDMKEKAEKFRPTLQLLEDNLTSLRPKVSKIEQFNRDLKKPGDDTDKLIKILQRGTELVLKCSHVQWWNYWDKANYKDKLEALNNEISRCITLDFGLLTYIEVLQKQVDSQKNHPESSDAVVSELQISQVEEPNGIWGVCSPPEPPPFTVGFDVHLNELKHKLLQDQVSVFVLTVTGSGGLGKTTLAKMFCRDDQVKGKFKESIFFVTFGKTPKLNTIVQKLFQHNSSPMPEFQSDEDVVKQLEHLLKQIGQNPILLVLDDVWPGSESLVDKFVFQIPNYKILMTSRSSIRRFGDLCLLKPLGEADAINLFRHSASLNQNSSDVPDDVVEEIVRSCGGFPLALTVTGRSLRQQHPVIWHDRAMKLSAGHSILDANSYVLHCLRKSLDVLDSKAINCFYDLGLFPEDQRIPAAALVDMWAELHKEEDASSMQRIFELVNHNMADIVVTRKIASGTIDCNYSYVTQYGLLRELAIHQTSKDPVDKRNKLIINVSGNNLPSWWTVEKQHPVAARLTSGSTDEASTLQSCNLQPPEVEVLVLNLREKKCTLPTSIKKMNKLKVLIITNYDLYPADLENFELLHHLSDLMRIRLEKVSIPWLSKTEVQLKHLHKISLFMCNVNEAFRNCIMPNLVEMNIDYCNMVELPVVLSNIVFLKKLSITFCHMLCELPEEIGELVNLESLRLCSCTGLVELPDSITSLHSLKFLDISNCSSLTKLPDNMGKLGNLEKLNVRGCLKLSELPSSVTKLRSLSDVVCDEETTTLWEPFRAILSGLKLEVCAS